MKIYDEMVKILKDFYKDVICNMNVEFIICNLI